MKRNRLLISLGNRIRQLRTKMGWSQEDFAGHADLDRTYIGGVERGERNVSVINLSRIAKTLKTSLSDLFKGI